MLELKSHKGTVRFSVLFHPAARILKLNRFLDYLQALDHGDIVLDWGSGDRPYEKLLLTKFDKYIAADHPQANAAHSRRPDLYVEDERIQLESGAVDCVVLTEVLEHIYDPRKALREMNRVLKPGGKLLGTVPFCMNEHEQPYDFHRYTSFCLHRMLVDAGFEVTHFDYVGDLIGTAITTTMRVFYIFVKILRRMRLAWVAWILHCLLKLPEVLYLVMLKIGINPQRVSYFRQFPLGFTFIAEKIGGTKCNPDEKAGSDAAPPLYKVDPPRAFSRIATKCSQETVSKTEADLMRDVP